MQSVLPPHKALTKYAAWLLSVRQGRLIDTFEGTLINTSTTFGLFLEGHVTICIF